jgi:hypothetical protein
MADEVDSTGDTTGALPRFELEIIRQGWIDDDGVSTDLCSHGDVRLVIGGHVIAPGDGSGDYTISTSALTLLRTLDSDHRTVPGGDNQVILCCEMILMTSCRSGSTGRPPTPAAVYD